MLVPYAITAVDLGTAISIATNRAMADGATHVSINGVQQVGPHEWRITIFADLSTPATRRGDTWFEGRRGGHWCSGFGCPAHS